jgi:molecular chaperone DnaK
VGHEAAKAALLEPDKAAECFKREMGRARYSRKVCGRDMRPEMLSAIVLKKLRQDAERKIGPIREAVITVPAYFDDTRRKATQDAGEIAGLNVIAIINEPTAAAINYGCGKAPAPGSEQVVLVYDLGGGTFDATLMRVCEGNQFATIATDGDVMLGGKDWDRRILDYVAGEFERKLGSDPRTDPISYQELSLRVEECKRTLSTRNTVIVPITHAGQRLGVPLDRAKFKELTADLLARTQTTLELLVSGAGLTWEQVDTILLSGGSTRMIMVREMMAKVAGKPPDTTLDEDLAVAKGAAIYAACLRLSQADGGQAFQESAAEKLKGLKHRSVNSHSLGVAAITKEGIRNITIIPRNTAIPVERSRSFGLSAADAALVRIKILEGEAPLPESCIRIGTCHIAGLPPGLPKGSPIDVTFAYSEDGRIHVHALVRAAGCSASVEIVRPEGLDGEALARQAQAVADLEVV